MPHCEIFREEMRPEGRAALRRAERLGGQATGRRSASYPAVLPGSAEVSYNPTMTNKEIADQILRGKKKSARVSSLRLATAIRVAGHRLGGVITVRATGKKAWTLTKSKAKVTHRAKKKTAKRAIANAR